jgi:hypothetical protein
MMYVFLIPMAAYFAMMFTVAFAVNVGYDIRSIETETLFVVYIQVYIFVLMFRKLKGAIYGSKDQTN